jgi:hypothetical protein
MDETQVTPDRPVEPVIVTRPGHSISRQDIDPDALKIFGAPTGFTAYPGAGGRDLMLGRPAKISTSSPTPPGQKSGSPEPSSSAGASG